MEKPDLSFTNDPEWLEQRLQLWKNIEEQLKPNFRKKELNVVQAYMTTGVVNQASPLPDSSLVNYFPLMNAEGWDYVYQNLVKKPDLFEYEFYHSTFGNMITQVSDEEKLRYFDYYHPAVFSPLIKSRVPICGEYVEIDVQPLKLFKFMAQMFDHMMENNHFSICFYRREYFFSVMLAANFDGDDRDSQRICGLLKRLMKNACVFQPKVVPEDDTNHLQFLSDLKHCLDTNTRNLSVDGIWQQVKEEQGVS